MKSFLKPGMSAANGGSMTMEALGIMQYMRENPDIVYIDRDQASTDAERKEIQRKSFTADAYFMSTNALTLDGELINVDGSGNRVAALIYGPDKVILAASMNKVESTREAALDRVRNIASPPNCVRLNRNTPCAKTGRCGDCLGNVSICSQILITRRSMDPERIHVVLIGEELGF